jgi:hypothetical protein
MQMVSTIGLDIAKSVFQVHGVDASGLVVIRRQLKRRYVLAFFEKLPPCLVGIEACASSHHWSRELQALGHTVRCTHLWPSTCPVLLSALSQFEAVKKGRVPWAIKLARRELLFRRRNLIAIKRVDRRICSAFNRIFATRIIATQPGGGDHAGTTLEFDRADCGCCCASLGGRWRRATNQYRKCRGLSCGAKRFRATGATLVLPHRWTEPPQVLVPTCDHRITESTGEAG